MTTVMAPPNSVPREAQGHKRSRRLSRRFSAIPEAELPRDAVSLDFVHSLRPPVMNLNRHGPSHRDLHDFVGGVRKMQADSIAVRGDLSRMSGDQLRDAVCTLRSMLVRQVVHATAGRR